MVRTTPQVHLMQTILKNTFGLEQGSNPGAGYNKAAGATDSDMTKG